MQLDPFQQAIIQAITEAHNALQEGVAQESLEIAHNEPILIEVYCGFSPILHNYGILGFNRDRGKFGFYSFGCRGLSLWTMRICDMVLHVDVLSKLILRYMYLWNTHIFVSKI